MSINVFTRSVNGYNRREVEEYINNMSRTFTRSKRDYEKKIEVLEAEIAKLKRELEARESFGADDAAPAETAEAYENESDVVIKSRRYDEVSRQLGEIIVNANAEASAIIDRADEKAKKALADTVSGIKAVTETLILRLDELAANAESELLSDTDAKDEE